MNERKGVNSRCSGSEVVWRNDYALEWVSDEGVGRCEGSCSSNLGFSTYPKRMMNRCVRKNDSKSAQGYVLGKQRI